MARSTEAIVFALSAAAALLVSACSDLPSRGDVLETVQHDVKEDASCTLPISLLSRLKMQHATKAVCVPREGGAPMDAAMGCLDALVASGATKRMPSSYMAEWPDDVSGAGFEAVSPYERRARDLIFKGCVEMLGDLRDGGFHCGTARADKIVRITKNEDNRALVRYSRAITLDPHVAAIDAACGAVARPAPEGTVTFEKVDKRWVLAEGSTSPASASSAH